MPRDVEKRQARVTLSVGLFISDLAHLHFVRIGHLAAIGCCSLQIHEPSLAPLVSVVVVPREVENRHAKVAESVGFLVTLLISILCKNGSYGCDWLLQSPDP